MKLYHNECACLSIVFQSCESIISCTIYPPTTTSPTISKQEHGYYFCQIIDFVPRRINGLIKHAFIICSQFFLSTNNVTTEEPCSQLNAPCVPALRVVEVGGGGADPENELGDGHRDGALPVGSNSKIDRNPDVAKISGLP